MKAIKLIGHPVILISIFLLLVIEGDAFGGIYLLYLLLALPHGAPYAIIALLGLIGVFIGYKVPGDKCYPTKLVMRFVGLVFMLLSLILFFAKGNKNATFEEPIPLLSFVLFATSALCFLTRTFSLRSYSDHNKNQNLNTVA